MIGGIRLVIAGGLMLAAAAAMAVFTDLNPATLFIAGPVLVLIGIVNAVPVRPGGAPGSADAASEAWILSNLQNSGSADSSAGLVDGH